MRGNNICIPCIRKTRKYIEQFLECFYCNTDVTTKYHNKMCYGIQGMYIHTS